jgi:hypothetical protein
MNMADINRGVEPSRLLGLHTILTRQAPSPFRSQVNFQFSNN